MKPVVSFFEGTPLHPLRHIASTKGHVVNNGLIGLTNVMGCQTPQSAIWFANAYGVGSAGIPTIPSIRIGTGAGSTVAGTTALTTIVSTAPNTLTGAISNPSTGNYKILISATWNAGTLAAITVTEAALWLYFSNVLQTFGAQTVTQNIYLFDRVSSTDSDFSSFVVNITKPLSCQYSLNLGFT